MSHEIAVQALGLVTQPNKLGQYPVGAMSVAQDVFIRSAGVVEVSPSATVLQTTSSLPSEILIPSDVEMLLISGPTPWKWTWFSLSTANTGSMTAAFNGLGLTNWARSRDKFLVTSANSLVIFDFAAPTSTAERTPRYAGLQAVAITATAGGTTASALKANTHASVLVIIRRTFANGYELISAASNVADTYSYVSDSDIVVSVSTRIGPDLPLRAGDVAEVYRTRAQPWTANTVGGTSCDATFCLTTTHVITTGDLAGPFFQIVDTTPDTGFGAAAYTNPGIGGAEATYIAPPSTNILATFKGYTFAFGLVEAAQRVVAILGGVGLAKVADPAAWRANLIGARELTGTWASGSAVITAVSAAHLVGLKVGQRMEGDPHFGSAAIISIGATTITMSANAGAGSGTTTFRLFDVVVVDGVSYSYGGLGNPNSIPSVEFLGSQLAGAARDIVLQFASSGFFSSTYTCVPSPLGRFSFAKARAKPDSASGFTDTFTLAATNGANYQPPFPEFGSTPVTVRPVTTPNGMAWTEEQQPEAWPPANRGHVGSGKLLAAAATRDAVWIFATDGLWRLSGNGGSVGAEGYDWRLDPVDSTLVISGPQALCVLRDTVYAYTSRGFVSIDDNGGVSQVSEGVIGDLLPGVPYSDTGTIEVRADQDNDEIWVVIGSAARVWNYNTRTWVRNVQLSTSGTHRYAYWPTALSIVVNDDSAGRALFFQAGLSTQSYPSAFVTYQPLYLDDPFTVKQWISATWVFDPANGSNMPGVAVNYNGSSYGFIVQPKLNSTDARVTFMVNRNAPALGPSLQLGLAWDVTVPVSKPPRLWGVSVLARVIGEGRVRRVP